VKELLRVSDKERHFGVISSAKNVAELRALEGRANGLTVEVTTTGRSGLFRFNSSDLSAEVSADEVVSGEGDGGIYIAPSFDKTGSSGAWVRQYGQAANKTPQVFLRWYGADEAADAAASIQKCLDAGHKHITGTPGATYSVSAPVVLRSGQTVDGGSAIELAAPGSSVVVFASNSVGTKLKNTKLRSNGNATSRVVLFSSGCTDCSLMDCEEISDTGGNNTTGLVAGVFFNSTCTDIEISGCEFKDSAMHIRIQAAVDGLTIKENRFRSYGRRAIYSVKSDGSMQNNITVKDNEFYAPLAGDIKYPCAFEVSLGATERRTALNIIGNRFFMPQLGYDPTDPESNTASADVITVRGTTVFSIVGNTIENSGDGGITLSSCSGGLVSGNIIRNVDSAGVFVSSAGAPASDVQDVNLIGNIIVNAGRNRLSNRSSEGRTGVKVNQSTRISISGNSITSPASTMEYGIYAENSALLDRGINAISGAGVAQYGEGSGVNVANSMLSRSAFAVPQSLRTISSGEIDAAGVGNIRLDTEGGAASDDLDTISGGVDGQRLRVRTNVDARDVVIKHLSGNIDCGTDITLSTRSDVAVFEYDEILSVWLLTSST
tara:strand:+ start:8244 stop:10058 length:1815 start_codon:yes stop_codon:yes gene_type:complete